MLVLDHTITEKVGLHASPAGILAKHASGLGSVITILFREKEADAKRLFSVMALGVECGDTITIRVEGKREKEDFESIKNFLENNL